jgi:hypothetical protein
MSFKLAQHLTQNEIVSDDDMDIIFSQRHEDESQGLTFDTSVCLKSGLSPMELNESLAEALGFPSVSLEQLRDVTSDLLTRISSEQAEAHQIFPLSSADDQLWLVSPLPLRRSKVQQLSDELGESVQLSPVPQLLFSQLLFQHYDVTPADNLLPLLERWGVAEALQISVEEVAEEPADETPELEEPSVEATEAEVAENAVEDVVEEHVADEDNAGEDLLSELDDIFNSSDETLIPELGEDEPAPVEEPATDEPSMVSFEELEAFDDTPEEPELSSEIVALDEGSTPDEQVGIEPVEELLEEVIEEPSVAVSQEESALEELTEDEELNESEASAVEVDTALENLEKVHPVRASASLEREEIRNFSLEDALRLARQHVPTLSTLMPTPEPTDSSTTLESGSQTDLLQGFELHTEEEEIDVPDTPTQEAQPAVIDDFLPSEEEFAEDFSADAEESVSEEVTAEVEEEIVAFASPASEEEEQLEDTTPSEDIEDTAEAEDVAEASSDEVEETVEEPAEETATEETEEESVAVEVEDTDTTAEEPIIEVEPVVEVEPVAEVEPVEVDVEPVVEAEPVAEVEPVVALAKPAAPPSTPKRISKVSRLAERTASNNEDAPHLTYEQAHNLLGLVKTRDGVLELGLYYLSSVCDLAAVMIRRKSEVTGRYILGKVTSLEAFRDWSVELNDDSVFGPLQDALAPFSGPAPRKQADLSLYRVLGMAPAFVYIFPIRLGRTLVAFLYGHEVRDPLPEEEFGHILEFSNEMGTALKHVIVNRKQGVTEDDAEVKSILEALRVQDKESFERQYTTLFPPPLDLESELFSTDFLVPKPVETSEEEPPVVLLETKPSGTKSKSSETADLGSPQLLLSEEGEPQKLDSSTMPASMMSPSMEEVETVDAAEFMQGFSMEEPPLPLPPTEEEWLRSEGKSPSIQFQGLDLPSSGVDDLMLDELFSDSALQAVPGTSSDPALEQLLEPEPIPLTTPVQISEDKEEEPVAEEVVETKTEEPVEATEEKVEDAADSTDDKDEAVILDKPKKTPSAADSWLSDPFFGEDSDLAQDLFGEAEPLPLGDAQRKSSSSHSPEMNNKASVETAAYIEGWDGTFDITLLPLESVLEDGMPELDSIPPSDKSAEVMLPMLENDSPEVRQIALESLRELPREKVAPTILYQLFNVVEARHIDMQGEVKPGFENTYAAVLWELVQHYPEETLYCVLPNLYDFSEQTRMLTLLLLQRLPYEPALPHLFRMLREPEPRVVYLSRKLIRKMYTSSTCQQLLRELRNKLQVSDVVQMSKAVRLLVTLRDEQSVPLLLEFLRDKNKQVVQTVSFALMEITKQQFGTSHRKWNKWWKKVGSQTRRVDWLIEGLQIKNIDVMQSSIDELVELTGQDLGFDPHDGRRERNAAVQLWKEWRKRQR